MAEDGNTLFKGLVGIGKTIMKYYRVILIVGALFLIGYIIWKSDPRELWEDVQNVNLNIILFVVVLYFTNLACKSFRWWILLRAGEKDVSKIKYFKVAQVFTATMAVNNISPGRAGGEPFKVILANKTFGVSTGKGLATVFIEKMMDLFMVLILALIGMVFLVPELSRDEATGIAIGTSIFFFILVAGMFIMIYREQFYLKKILKVMVAIFRKTLGKGPAKNINQKGLKLIENFRESIVFFKRNRSPLLIVAIITIIVWLNEAFRLWLILYALEVDLSFGIALVTSSIATVSGMVVPFGLGHMAGIVPVLVALGVEESKATIAAALFVGTSLWLCVPTGALIMLITGIRPSKAGKLPDEKTDRKGERGKKGKLTKGVEELDGEEEGSQQESSEGSSVKDAWVDKKSSSKKSSKNSKKGKKNIKKK